MSPMGLGLSDRTDSRWLQACIETVAQWISAGRRTKWEVVEAGGIRIWIGRRTFNPWSKVDVWKVCTRHSLVFALTVDALDFVEIHRPILTPACQKTVTAIFIVIYSSENVTFRKIIETGKRR